MTNSFINPLDFKYIFLNVFLGNIMLLPFVLVILFSFVSAKLGFSNKTYFVTLIIGLVLFAAYIGEAMFAFVLLIVGVIVFKGLSRIFT